MPASAAAVVHQLDPGHAAVCAALGAPAGEERLEEARRWRVISKHILLVGKLQEVNVSNFLALD